MSTIYVDGDNGNDSTADPTNPLTPRKSIANLSIFTNAGQVIRLKRGTNIALNKSDGLNINASQTWEAYYNSDGSDDTAKPQPVVYLQNNTDSWVCSSASGTITFRNIDIDGRFGNPNGLEILISVRRGAFLQATNVNIYRAAGGFGVGPGGAELDRCTTKQMHGGVNGFGSVWGGQSGFARPKNILIKNCYFDSSSYRQLKRTDPKCLWYGLTEGITMHDGNADGGNIVILNTTVISGHENALDFAQATNADYGVYIAGCRFYGSKSGLNTISTDDLSNNFIFVGNIITGYYNAVLLRGNNHKLYGNLIINNEPEPGNSLSGAITCTGTTGTNIVIDNNTIVVGPTTIRAPLQANYTNPGSITFSNNIVISKAPGVVLVNNNNASTVVTYGKNWWYKPNTTLTNEFIDGNVGKPSATFTTDWPGQTYGTEPQLDKNYKPYSGSNVLNGGVHTAYKVDPDGNTFNNPPTYGAYEYTVRGIR